MVVRKFERQLATNQLKDEEAGRQLVARYTKECTDATVEALHRVNSNAKAAIT